MTATVLPSVFQLEKPQRVLPSFSTVRGAELNKIPGKKGLPVLGILPEAVRDPFRFTRQMYENYGPVHRFYACGSWNV